MRRCLLTAIGLLSACAAVAAGSQTPSGSAPVIRRARLQFVDSPAPNSVVSGQIVLHVDRDPIMRPEWEKVALRIPGQPDIFPDLLPFDHVWDTRISANGENLVRIVLVDKRSGSITVADSLDLWVRNSRSRPASPRIAESSGDTRPETGAGGATAAQEPIVITIRGPKPAAPGPHPNRPGPGTLPPLTGIGPSSAKSASGLATGDDAAQSTGSASPADNPATSPEEVRATYGRHQWYIRCGVLFHEDSLSRTIDAFLPWNGSGLAPSTVIAAPDGARVQTSGGMRFVSLVKPPDPARGYDGYVRVRLGSASDRGQGASAQKLSSVINSWQGVPYVWGGSSRSGVDCSGFVMATYSAMGVGLPHGSMYLRSFRSDRPSTVVRDELRYGDVLVYPGHCAIYTGEGSTAETVGGHVGRGTIWIRDSVVVRRFLDTSTERPWERSLYASRGGRPRRR